MGASLNLPDPQDLRSRIEQDGYAILHDAVPADFIDRQRARWMSRFTPAGVTRKFVRGNLALGEANFLSYSRIPDWCMYRNFEFLWNANDDKEAFDLHVRLHKYRNLVQGFDENYGLTYNPECYGVYISTSYYPPGSGMLKAHIDGHGVIPILHYMLPLTYKGGDYQGGGLFCADKKGKDCDLDALMKPGSLIFFDGRQKHWVETIQGFESAPIGRLAVFAIPTIFTKDTKLHLMRRSARIAYLEIANRLGLVNLSRY